MKSPRTFICMTNIPSPYRVHEFEQIYYEMKSNDIEFRVFFMVKTEKGRYWEIRSCDWKFPFIILKGFIFYIGNRIPVIFNPWVIFRLMLKPPDWLLLGGSWYHPSVILALLVSRVALRRRTIVLLWNENVQSDYIDKGFLLRVKKKVLGCYNGYIVPGKNAREYIEHIGNRKVGFVELRNFVDESQYYEKVNRFREEKEYYKCKWGVSNEEIVLLIPARLVKVKGILPFLEAIKQVEGIPFSILIAGEGELRRDIEDWKDKNRAEFLKVLGHQNDDSLLELYAIADILVLPSLHEKYGFVAVEGLWASLPLLLSDKVGSLPEVLKVGENGWVFKAGNPDETRRAFLEAVTLGRKQLIIQGNTSLEIARERFASSNCANRFVRELIETFPPHR